ncbi:MAG: hypothetical protein K0B52_03845 [FCB group bacterium]|nr:hypothetical protein [FCB group bacterium]
MKYITVILLLTVIQSSYGEDNENYPEFLAGNFFEEYESGARVHSQISYKNHFAYKHTVVIERGALALYYRGTGGTGDPDQLLSASLTSDTWQAGIGRGRPHIARGVILGNNMMRFTADPASNFRSGMNYPKVRNYDYYPRLYYTGVMIRKINAGFFYYKDTPCVLAEITRHSLQTGAAYYGTDVPVAESWFAYNKNNFRSDMNLSITPRGFNHFSTDLLITHTPFSWHLGAVRLSEDFTALAGDSKWGSALKPGSCGLTAAMALSAGRWKFRGSAYHVYNIKRSEQRLTLDAVYRKKPFEIGIIFTGKYVSELKMPNDFPAGPQRRQSSSDILKGRIKVDLSRKTVLDIQVLGDPRCGEAYGFFYRVTHRTSDGSLRLQYTRGKSANTVLYVLRPLNHNRYLIQRLPLNETQYLDLVYSRMLGPLRCSILVSPGGIAAEMEYTK